jgi:hypothetical protein
MPLSDIPNVNGQRDRTRAKSRYLELFNRRAQVLVRRNQGIAFEKIAEEFGICRSVARRDFKRAVEESYPRETIQHEISLTLSRYEDLYATYYPLAKKGDLAAAEYCRKLLHDRRQLLGLDPATGQPSVHIEAHQHHGIQVSFVPGIQPGDPRLIEEPLPTPEAFKLAELAPPPRLPILIQAEPKPKPQRMKDASGFWVEWDEEAHEWKSIDDPENEPS